MVNRVETVSKDIGCSHTAIRFRQCYTTSREGTLVSILVVSTIVRRDRIHRHKNAAGGLLLERHLVEPDDALVEVIVITCAEIFGNDVQLLVALVFPLNHRSFVGKAYRHVGRMNGLQMSQIGLLVEEILEGTTVGLARVAAMAGCIRVLFVRWRGERHCRGLEGLRAGELEGWCIETLELGQWLQ